MRIKRFEELECWQEARRLTRIIYGHTRQAEFSKDFEHAYSLIRHLKNHQPVPRANGLTG